ncbi:Uncharacterized membrane protein YfcA [Palleronia pelagia]|uniref:Probable membrane transporter protein n=2 Tax=Palleronia pelagia TaxID=387096 RepID=A0A1H8AHZ3_9RHOB|nr:Uncharacterized membrane protein YfcA [Palleronia pelagia]
MDLVPIVLALALAGLAIGFLAGLFGVGGGAVSVPVFFEVFRATGSPETIAMPMAVGTSLAIIVPTAISASLQHARKGTVEGRVLRLWALPILLGVVAGSAIASIAAPAVFQGVFAAVALLLSVRMLTGGAGWRLSDDLPSGPVLSGYGAVIGLLSSLMGIGGGALSTMALTLHGRPIHVAVSTSAGVGILIAVPGTIGYAVAGWGAPGLPPGSIGFVSLLAVAIPLPASLLATRLGVSVGHALSREALTRLFGAFLLLVGLRFAVAVIPGLGG